MSNFIVHNTYTGRMRYFCSKLTHIHGPVNKPELQLSYSRRHVSWLPQVIYKRIINSLSQKVIYVSMMIDQVISEFSPNKGISYLNICDNSIINVWKQCFYLGFSNTSNAESLYGFRKVVIEKVHNDIENLKKKVLNNTTRS